MAINIVPPNFSNLSSGSTGGNLNLTVPGELGLKSLQLKQDKENALMQAAIEQAKIKQADEASLRQSMLSQAQLGQQAQQYQQTQDFDRYKTGLLAQQSQQNQALDATKVGLLAQQQNRDYALDATKVNLEAEKLKQQQAADHLKLEMTQLASKKKEDIDNMGAFAVQGLVSMEKMSTPQDAMMLQNSILSEAAKNGYVPKEEIAKLQKLTPDEFKQALQFKVLQLKHVSDYQTMAKANGVGASSGNTTVTLPDGTVVESQGLTKPQQTKTQEDLIKADEGINQLQEFYNKVPDKYFGASALNQSATKGMEWAQNIPILGDLVKPSDADKKDLMEYSKFKAKADRMALDTIKTLSGVSYTDSQLDFLKDVLPAIGPGAVKSEFDGKAGALMEYLNRVKQAKQKLLGKGLVLESPEYKAQMLDELRSATQDLTPATAKQKVYKYNPTTGKWSNNDYPGSAS